MGKVGKVNLLNKKNNMIIMNCLKNGFKPQLETFSESWGLSERCSELFALIENFSISSKKGYRHTHFEYVVDSFFGGVSQSVAAHNCFLYPKCIDSAGGRLASWLSNEITRVKTNKRAIALWRKGNSLRVCYFDRFFLNMGAYQTRLQYIQRVSEDICAIEVMADNILAQSELILVSMALLARVWLRFVPVCFWRENQTGEQTT